MKNGPDEKPGSADAGSEKSAHKDDFIAVQEAITTNTMVKLLMEKSETAWDKNEIARANLLSFF